MSRLAKDPSNLDELDLRLLRELEQDARVSDVKLASKLGTSNSTVGRRVKRLIDQGIIMINVIPGYSALGYGTILTMAVKAPPGMVSVVAEQLASADNVEYLWITAGRYDILAVALYRSPEEYVKSFPEEIGDIPENTMIETMLSFKLTESGDPDPTKSPDAAVAFRSRFNPTELDFSLIRALQISPRASVNELAGNIGVSVSSVHASLRKLTSRGIIQVKGISKLETFGHTIWAVILIKVQPSTLKTVTDKLQVHPSVRHLRLHFGAFNCIMRTSFQNSEEMYAFLDRDLGSMPGIVHFESLVILRVQKYGFMRSNGGNVNGPR